MARRRKPSLWEDSVKGLSQLPWWVSLALAPLAYVIFHLLATPPGGTPASGQMGAHAVRLMLAALASFLQYIIPIACLFASAISAWRQIDRRALLDSVTHNPSAHALNDIPWQRFEHLVGEAFRRQGYEVRENGSTNADGGVDLELRKDGELHLVQCKQRKAYKVGVEVVRELFGVMAARGAASGYVVTSGTFTEPAQEFAKGSNVRLIDGPRLKRLLESVADIAVDPAAPRRPVDSSRIIPACPLCAKPMVLRTATRGPNKGDQFWGCGRYPACRGTRSL
jgi:restriction system protein